MAVMRIDLAQALAPGMNEAIRAALKRGRVLAIPTDTTYGLAVDLCVFYPNGQSFKAGIHHSQEPKPGCWSWPPRT